MDKLEVTYWERDCCARRSQRAVLRVFILLLAIAGCSAPNSGSGSSKGRFVACPDGLTVADQSTGLLWEKKTGGIGNPVFVPGGTGPPRRCIDPVPERDPSSRAARIKCGDFVVDDVTGQTLAVTATDVNNSYTWSINGSTGETGVAFENFLERLNTCSPGFLPDCWDTYPGDPPQPPPAVPAPPFAGYDDWRLPSLEEWQTILVGVGAGPGQSKVCSTLPCTDPEFTALAGPSQKAHYWSGSGLSDQFPEVAWYADLTLGIVNTADKAPGQNRGAAFKYVRAVRTGVCSP